MEKQPAIGGSGTSATPLSTSDPPPDNPNPSDIPHDNPSPTSDSAPVTLPKPQYFNFLKSQELELGLDWRPSESVGPDLEDYFRPIFEAENFDRPPRPTTALAIPGATTTGDPPGMPLYTSVTTFPAYSHSITPHAPISTSVTTPGIVRATLPSSDGSGVLPGDVPLSTVDDHLRYKAKGKAIMDNSIEGGPKLWTSEMYYRFGRRYHEIVVEDPDLEWVVMDKMLGTLFKDFGAKDASLLRSAFEIVLPGVKRYGLEILAELFSDPIPDQPLRRTPLIGYLCRAQALLHPDTSKLDEMIARKVELPLAEVTPLRLFCQAVDLAFGNIGGFATFRRIYEGFNSIKPNDVAEESSDEALAEDKLITKGRGNKWQDKEINFLKERLKKGEISDWDLFLKELAAVCGNNRTKRACLERMTLLGLNVGKKVPRWKPEEDDVLLAYYKEATNKNTTVNFAGLLEALKAIKGRTRTRRACEERWLKLKGKDNAKKGKDEVDGDSDKKS